jgi:hypothetical protein
MNVLKANDILRTMTESSGSRPAVLAYPALLNVAEGREAF